MKKELLPRSSIPFEFRQRVTFDEISPYLGVCYTSQCGEILIPTEEGITMVIFEGQISPEDLQGRRTYSQWEDEGEGEFTLFPLPDGIEGEIMWEPLPEGWPHVGGVKNPYYEE